MSALPPSETTIHPTVRTSLCCEATTIKPENQLESVDPGIDDMTTSFKRVFSLYQLGLELPLFPEMSTGRNKGFTE